MLCATILLSGCSKSSTTNEGENLGINNESNNLESDEKINGNSDANVSVDQNLDLSDVYHEVAEMEEVATQQESLFTTITENTSETTYIKFDGNEVKIEGSGCTVKDGKVSIKEAGTYELNGTYSDGSIVVNVDEGEYVHLILNGVSITSNKNAPIYIKDAPLTKITLMDGTVNTLIDAADYVYEDEVEQEPSAALFSKDDLIIDGNGTLKIEANFNDGSTCKARLRIESGTFVIKAAYAGIIGR